VDESLLEAAFRCSVWHGCQAHKAFLEQINLQGLERGNKDVKPQVVLVPSDQVGFFDVFGDDVARSRFYLLLFADNFDASAT